MSEAIAFDTHRFVKNLTDHGFTEEQAEVLANEQVNLLNSNLSTKTDIEALRLSTKADIALIQRDIEALRKETKADIEALRQATKTDLALIQQDIEVLRKETKTDIALVQRDIEVLRKETKADIANLKADLLKWMFGALIAQGGVIVTLIVALMT